MSRKITQFVILPNEIICNIFDFLTTFDILRAFTQLNHRYNNLIQFYIKKIDLTNDWQGNHHQLQWICRSIQILKIDQRHIYYLSNYQFNKLLSLSLINVINWQNVMLYTNLKCLYIWFDDCHNYYSTMGVIPQNVLRFSTNTLLTANTFHINLIHLSLHVYSLVHLVEIIKRTPNLQHLCVTLWSHHTIFYASIDDEFKYFEMLTSSFCCLTILQYLSISVTFVENGPKYSYISSDNKDRLLFDQLQIFIDRCCPNKVILKQVALKLHYIRLYDNLWSTLLQYKKTFDRFDFYVSFKIPNRTLDNINIPSTINPIGFHVEGHDDLLQSQDCYLHVYSLPFAFDSLYGFTSCSELKSQCSFFSVRHLYFTEISLSRPISFQSLVKYMPRLVSIDCILTFNDSNINVSEIIIDSDIFPNIHSLRFSVNFSNNHIGYHDLLSRLLQRMPYLRRLIPFEEQLSYAFSSNQLPLASIKLLDLRQSNFKAFDILPQRVPFLSTLLLNSMIPNAEKISQIISNLFIRIPSLRIVSYEMFAIYSQDPMPYEKAAEQAHTLMQKMNDYLQHLSFHFELGTAEFSL